MDLTPVNILCLKWGTRYGPHYVNILFKSVTRHLKRPFRFYCCTENATGLADGIRIIPFPSDPGMPAHRPWPDIMVKLLVTKDGFGDLRGPTLFLDLDIAILDDIGPFFDYQPGKNCIIHNWIPAHKTLFRPRPLIGNSSVFRYEAGNSGYICDAFLKDIPRSIRKELYTTEQAFLTEAMKEVHWWPDSWCRSYKRHCRPIFPLNLLLAPSIPADCRILVFHGRPDPDEAIRGYHGKRVHHHMRPSPWIANHWKD